jgi:hypothetical protein
MDPASALEIAKALFAGISAAAAAIQVWYKSREKAGAAREFDQVYKKTLESPQAAVAATELVAIIPEEIIRQLETRARACWTGFRKVLDPREFLPDEVDNATEAVQACVCRELGRILKLNGEIPKEWLPQWQRYDCKGRNKARPVAAPSRVMPPPAGAGA